MEGMKTVLSNPIISSLIDSRARILSHHLMNSNQNNPSLNSMAAKEIIAKIEGAVPSRRDTLRAMKRTEILSPLIKYENSNGKKTSARRITMYKDNIINNDDICDTCYVYIIESDGFKKVGFSNAPEERIDNLSIGNPKPCKLLLKIKCNNRENAYNLEKSLHELLSPHQIKGEWFDISFEQIFTHIIIKLIKDKYVPEIILTSQN